MNENNQNSNNKQGKQNNINNNNQEDNIFVDQNNNANNHQNNNNNQEEKKDNNSIVNNNNVNNNDNSKMMGELSSVIGHIDNLNKYYNQLCEKEGKLRIAIQNHQLYQQRYHFLHFNTADVQSNQFQSVVQQPPAFIQLTHHQLPTQPLKNQPQLNGGVGQNILQQQQQQQQQQQIPTLHHQNYSIYTNIPGQPITQAHTRQNSSEQQFVQQQQGQQQQQPVISQAYQKFLQEKDSEIQRLKQEIQQIKIMDEDLFKNLREQQIQELQIQEGRVKEVEIQAQERQKTMQQQLEQNYQKRIQELENQVQIEKNKLQEFIVQKYKKLEEKIKDLAEEADIHKNKSLSLEKLLRNNPDKAQFENELRKLQQIIVQQNHELDALRLRVAQQQQLPLLMQQQQMQTGHNLVLSQNQNQLYQEIERLKNELDRQKFTLEEERIRLRDKDMEIEMLKQFNKNFQPKAVLESENDVLKIKVNNLEKELEGLKILIIKKVNQPVLPQDENFEERVRELDIQQIDNNQKKRNEESLYQIEEENAKLRDILKDYIQENNQLKQRLSTVNNNQPEIQLMQVTEQQLSPAAQKLPTQLSERCDYLDNLCQQYKQQAQQAVAQHGILEQQIRKLQNALELKLHEAENLKIRLNTQDGNVDQQDINMKKFLNDAHSEREMLGTELMRLKLAFEQKLKECETLRGHVTLKAGDSSQLEQALRNAENRINTMQLEQQQIVRDAEAKVSQMNAENQAQRRDYEQKCSVLQQELQRVTLVLREKINESDALKGHAMKLEGNLKENVNNIERVFRDNQNKSQVVTSELEKITIVLREKMKESDELRVALARYEGLIKEKTMQNEELAKKCQTLVIALNEKQLSEQRVQDLERKCQALMVDLERVTTVLKEKAQQNDELARKCQQLTQALNERLSQEARIMEYDKKCQILTVELEKITGAFKEKLREIDILKVNFARVEQFVKEREVIEQEMRRMKELLQIKVQECEEWKLKCREMEGRLQRAAQLEEKFRQQENKLRYLMTQIRDLPNKVLDNY